MIQPGSIIRCERAGLVQTFLCGDLMDSSVVDWYRDHLPGAVGLVYSEPPWNPANAHIWRSLADKACADRRFGPCTSYDTLLDRWCEVVSLSLQRGARDVFCAQSMDERHHAMFMAAVQRAGWSVVELERWSVFYGSPGSAGCRTPNLLLHFGSTPLATDPSGMRGEAAALRVCAGLAMAPGETVVDPCIGKGMTSRIAHYFGWSVVGSEINPARLATAVQWLGQQGYTTTIGRGS